MSALTGFVLDLWETVDCSYCGAKAGEECITRSGVRTTKSHSQRICWVERICWVDATDDPA